MTFLIVVERLGVECINRCAALLFDDVSPFEVAGWNCTQPRAAICDQVQGST